MKSAVGLAVALVGLALGQPASRQIVIDGEFDDWVQVTTGVVDPADSPTGVDIRAVRVSGDDRHLFVQADFERAVNIEKLAGTLAIAFDLDDDAETGQLVDGLNGSDVVVELSPPNRTGSTVRRYSGRASPPANEAWSAAGLALAPHYTSERMELRIDRGTARAARVKLTYRRAAAVLDETVAVRVEMPPAAVHQSILASPEGVSVDPLARAPARSGAWWCGTSGRCGRWCGLDTPPSLRHSIPTSCC